ncbi:MAG: cytochrome c-type biogenesis protein [Rickettsiales bacterium]
MCSIFRLLTIFFVCVLCSHAALSLTIDSPLKDVEKEKQAREIFKQIRCMVCQGETIADSNADVAKDMRIFIRSKIDYGMTEEQIKKDLAGRYGDVILMKPPFNTQTFLLWLAPVIALLFGGVMIYLYFRNMKLTNDKHSIF